MFSNVLSIPVVRVKVKVKLVKVKVKLALAIPTGAPTTLVNEIIDTTLVAALKTIKILSI